MSWRQLVYISKLLGEKSNYFYLYIGNALYIVMAVSAKNEGIDFLTKEYIYRIHLPLFFFLGMTQAISYFCAKHIIHSVCPEGFREELTTYQWGDFLQKERTAVVKEFETYLENLRSLSDAHVRSTLNEIKGTVEDDVFEKIIDAASKKIILKEQEASVYRGTIEKLKSLTIDGQNTVLPPYRLVCTALMIASIVAFLAHTTKLLMWAYGLT